MPKHLVFLFLILFIIPQSKAEMKQPTILPYPQLISLLEGSLSLEGGVRIVNEFEKSAETGYVTAKLRASGLEITDGGAVPLKLVRRTPEELTALGAPFETVHEAYRLVITPEGIVLEAAAANGLFYAAGTLEQIIRQTEGTHPALEVIDYPQMKFRGISDDISRGQVSTVENFKKILDEMAAYKMNTYMPYLEDMLKFEAYPQIGEGRGALTKDEVKEIVAYAQERFIEVIPIFQTLGHYENILTHPDFVHLAEYPGAASLCVSCDSTYIFLEELLEEVFEMFPSKYFHIGADESYDVGLGKSRDLVEKDGIAKVHADHYKKVYDIVKAHGREVIMYGDIVLHHEEILEMLPKDIAVVYWYYRPLSDYPDTRKLQSYKFDYFVSPSVWNFTSTFPVHLNALPNITTITEAGIKNGSVGMINSNWGDYGAETFKELIYYGYAWSAQCAWNFQPEKLHAFTTDYFDWFFGNGGTTAARIYERFSHTMNQVMWHEVWRHPALPQREHRWWTGSLMNFANRIEWMNLTLPAIEEDLEQLRAEARANEDHIAILEYMLQFNRWYKLKMEASLAFERVMEGGGDVEEAVWLAEANIAALAELRDGYKSTWLRYYKPANLNMIEDKFNRLIAWFGETRDDLADGQLASPLITSDWIYAVDADSDFVSKAEFRRTLDLPAAPERAALQLIGDSHVKLYINGEHVDEVYVRRSLSLYPEYKRVKTLDISGYLKAGENTIRAEAENFSRSISYEKGYPTGLGAGINLLGKVELPGEMVTITTGDEWQARFADREWKNAVVDEYRFKVIKPNFDSGRPSWIER